MKPYKLLIFDLDGTVADTDMMIVKTMEDLYRFYLPNHQTTYHELLKFSGPPIKETLKKCFPAVDIKDSYDKFLELSDPNYRKYVKLFPNELEVLEKFKSDGYKLALVTNKNHRQLIECLIMLKINHIFDIIIGFDDMKVGKPDPEGIFTCLARFNIDKKDAIYIGDTIYDCLTAKNAGVDLGIVTWVKKDIQDFKPDYEFISYEEMYQKLHN